MSLKALFAVLGILGIFVEVALFAILIARHQYRLFPVFTVYMGFNLLNDFGVGALLVMYPQSLGRNVAFALLPLQYLLELSVLLEIAWKVLSPVHASLPKGSIRSFAGLIGLSILAGTLLAWRYNHTGNQIQDFKQPLDLTVGMLRMLIFVATAAFAQLLGIGWKNKVLQLATALSFYSAIDLIVSLAVHFLGESSTLERIRPFSYLLELGFLLWVFTTKDVERREFSPQMERFLVTLAGRAKHARTVLVRMQVK
jgi:hypothetical protein